MGTSFCQGCVCRPLRAKGRHRRNCLEWVPKPVASQAKVVVLVQDMFLSCRDCCARHVFCPVMIVVRDRATGLDGRLRFNSYESQFAEEQHEQHLLENVGLLSLHGDYEKPICMDLFCTEFLNRFLHRFLRGFFARLLCTAFLHDCFRSRAGKPNQRKGQNEKFMNFAHYCEFWCFSFGRQARFTLNFCSGNAPVKKFMN